MNDIAARIAADGLDYASYLAIMARQAAAVATGLDELAAERLGFTQLNLHRSERIGRHWRPSAELSALMARIAAPQSWLVLTEPWCGDSAQCLPCIAALAADHPSLELRLLLRDDHTDVMDRYLTDGKRSIPRLIAFDDAGREQFRWGPRPAAAQAVWEAAKADGLDKPAILERLHLFYGRDRGRALDAEFVALLGAWLEGCP